jgi:hypothetical protein
MINKDDELKYKDVINSLKGLQKVNAPQNFETNLTRRINLLGSEKKESFWRSFFVPSKLIPSAALAVSAVVLLFVFNTNSNNEDPLLTNPRVRTDIISTDDISRVELSPDQNTVKSQSGKSLSSNSDKLGDQKTYTDSDKRNNALALSNFEYSIDKKGLNFRQANLSKEERESVTRVKDRFIKLMENSKSN